MAEPKAPRRCAFCGSKKSPHLYGLDKLGRVYACRACDPHKTEEEIQIGMRLCAEAIARVLGGKE